MERLIINKSKYGKEMQDESSEPFKDVCFSFDFSKLLLVQVLLLFFHYYHYNDYLQQLKLHHLVVLSAINKKFKF